MRECRSIRSGASGLPYYCAPLVCVSDVIEFLALWRHNKPKLKPDRPLLLSAPPVVICLCIVLPRYLARVQAMTLVEVVLGRVLLGVVHAGADAVPREM